MWSCDRCGLADMNTCREAALPHYNSGTCRPARRVPAQVEAPFLVADSTDTTGQMLAVRTSAPADAQQRVATEPLPCDRHADAGRHLRCGAGCENGSNATTRNSAVLCDGFLRGSLRTSGRSAQSCAGSTPTSSLIRAACVAGAHWTLAPSLPPRPSPPIPSHPHPHPMPPHSPPPARAGSLLPCFCVLICIMVFALRRAMGAGCEGLVVSVVNTDVCGVQIWQAVLALLPAGAKRWLTAVRSKWAAVPALRRAGKPRSTLALHLHRRALGLLEMAQTCCGPGRRIKHPHGAGRRRSGHALRSLVHLVLLSAASGWRLPNSQRAPPDAEAVRSPQRANTDMFVETLRRRLAISGCNGDWYAPPGTPRPFLLRDQPCRRLLPAATIYARPQTVLVTIAVNVTMTAAATIAVIAATAKTTVIATTGSSAGLAVDVTMTATATLAVAATIAVRATSRAV